MGLPMIDLLRELAALKRHVRKSAWTGKETGNYVTVSVPKDLLARIDIALSSHDLRQCARYYPAKPGEPT